MLSINNIWTLTKWTTRLFCFQDLKLVGISLPKYTAELAENRGKNRYNNVLPCELFFPQDLSFCLSLAVAPLTVEGSGVKIVTNHLHNYSGVTCGVLI